MNKIKRNPQETYQVYENGASTPELGKDTFGTASAAARAYFFSLTKKVGFNKALGKVLQANTGDPSGFAQARVEVCITPDETGYGESFNSVAELLPAPILKLVTDGTGEPKWNTAPKFNDKEIAAAMVAA